MSSCPLPRLPQSGAKLAAGAFSGRSPLPDCEEDYNTRFGKLQAVFSLLESLFTNSMNQFCRAGHNITLSRPKRRGAGADQLPVIWLTESIRGGHPIHKL